MIVMMAHQQPRHKSLANANLRYHIAKLVKIPFHWLSERNKAKAITNYHQIPTGM